jgi:hypothetical protein
MKGSEDMEFFDIDIEQGIKKYITEEESYVSTVSEQEIKQNDIDTSSNSSDIHIKEEPWSNNIELLLHKWRNQVLKLSEVHDESGYIVKFRYQRLAVPVIMIPFIMGLVTQNLSTESTEVPLVNGIMFMITGTLNGFQTFFSYGQLYEQHFQYSARYSDVVNRIDSELARKRKFRTPADVFITEIKCRIDNLNDTAPTLPGMYC